MFYNVYLPQFHYPPASLGHLVDSISQLLWTEQDFLMQALRSINIPHKSAINMSQSFFYILFMFSCRWGNYKLLFWFLLWIIKHSTECIVYSSWTCVSNRNLFVVNFKLNCSQLFQSFEFEKIFVSQDVVYFSNISMCFWIECVSLVFEIEYSVDVC